MESRFRNYITNESILLKNVSKLTDGCEKILNLYSFKSIQINIQSKLSSTTLQNTFIVVQTNSGYWSFEKLNGSIFGQLAKDRDGVTHKYDGKCRYSELVEEYKVKDCTLASLLAYIIETKCVALHHFDVQPSSSREFERRIVEKFVEWKEAKFRNYVTNEIIMLKNFIKITDNADEKIINFWTFKSSTESFSPAFIVLQSNNGYWSLEKSDSGIFLQLAENIDGVSKIYDGNPRDAEIVDEFKIKSYSIGDILAYIVEKELHISYDSAIERNNCDGFNKRIIVKFVEWKEARFRNHITDEDLLLKNVPNIMRDVDEKITRLWCFNTPKSKEYVNAPIVYHRFIVVQTNSGFWFFEKSDCGIFGQLAEKREELENNCVTTDVIEDYPVKDCSIMELLTYLIDKELTIPYNSALQCNNSHGFSTRIIDGFKEIKEEIKEVDDLTDESMENIFD